MKINKFHIHNYRSIGDQTIQLGGYSLLIGANNSGKSNAIDALRTFYEKDLKFDYERDFPKFPADDDESWIEVEYTLSDTEAATIKDEYLIDPGRFRVRKWLYPQEKAKQGLFGYESKKLSENLFYGWKNVGQAKLGSIIYVPAVSRLEEHTKLTGPSALRDLINDIIKPIIRSSAAFSSLTGQFKEFGSAIKTEETTDKRSLSGLEGKINEEIQGWGAVFNLEVTSPQEDDIVKNLIRYTVTDSKLDKAMEAGSFGHGFQRHLIFTLVRIAASYSAPKPEPKKKEFAPELELLLFEEPEAFLHPPQQNELDTSLRQLASQTGRQVLAATHSPLFVSYNADDIADLVCFSKDNNKTQIGQIGRTRLMEIFEDNRALNKIFESADKSGEAGDGDVDWDLELEETRHFLWLNPERCGMFFANRVLIVEGLSEQVVTNYLIKTGQISVGSRGAFVLEPWGKFNIHRFMNLLGGMQIKHAVLHDLDSGKTGKKKVIQDGVNELIQKSRNDSTVTVDTIPKNLEAFFDLALSEGDRWKKAAKILLAVKRNEVPVEKIEAFKKKVETLLA